MFPFIINYNDIVIPTFFFMIMVGSLAATFYIYWQAGQKKMSQIAMLDIGMIGTVTGVVGARIFHILAEAPAYYWEKPVRVFYFWQGGFVGYGAFLGILIGGLAYLRMRKLPVLQYADLIALGAPLIVFFVRIGCVGAGCCYGKPTDFFFHLVFDNLASEASQQFRGVPLHATQIYDMLNAVVTFVLVHWLYKRKKFDGQILLAFFMSYAFFRFLIEFLRGDLDRGVYFNGLLSTSQFTSAVFLVLGGLLWKWLGSRKKTP